MFSRYALRTTKFTTRTFSSTSFKLAIEDEGRARAARLQVFLETIRANEPVRNQLKSVQIVIASKLKDQNETPSLMQQLKLLMDKEVKAEMAKLSEIMKQENINIQKEDVAWLMQAFKAQMDQSEGEGKGNDKK